MNSTRSALFTLLVLFFAVPALAQSDKQFNKDGLLFDYPSGWVLKDDSDGNAQQLLLGKSDIDVQIKVFVFRTPVNTPARFAEAKRVLVDPYVNSTAKQLEQMGGKPERVPASTEIGTATAEGVKVQVVLDGEGGAAEIFWASVGQKLVVLTLFGPDKDRQKATPTWDKVKKSLQVEVKDAAETPAEKPKPE